MTSTEVAIRSEFSLTASTAADVWAEEMEGDEVEFPSITTPKAGSTTWEVEGEAPSRELRGVVVDAFVAHALFLDEYNPANPAPPDAYWIAGKLQYLTDRARQAGFDPESHETGDRRISQRLVLYLARPGKFIPLRIDLSGPSVRPWRLFKQNYIAGAGRRVTEAAVELTLESVKYKSGFTGSVLVPKLLGWVDEDSARAYYEQREQIRPFTRMRTAPAVLEDGGTMPAPSGRPSVAQQREDAQRAVPSDDGIPF